MNQEPCLIFPSSEISKPDVSKKFIVASKEQLGKLKYFSDYLQLDYKNDSIVRISEVITHPPIKQFDYYFKNGKLVLVRFHQDRYCSDQFFFFDKEND